MAVNVASKYDGDYGVEVTPLKGYYLAGCKRVANPTRFRQSFYLHPNGVTIPDAGYIIIARNYHLDLSQAIYRVRLLYSSSLYQITYDVQRSSGTSYYGGNNTLDNQNDWNLIEIDEFFDVSGFFKIWLNGVLKWNQALDNTGLSLFYPCIGSVASTTVSSGTFYLAHWKANITGDALGGTVPPPPPPPPFSLDADFETGDFSQTTSQYTDGSALTVDVSAGLNGTNCGMSVFINDTDAKYVVVSGLNSATGKARVRFYIDPNSLTMAENDEFTVLRLLNLDGLSIASILLHKSAADYQLQAAFSWDDGDSNFTAYVTITDAPHYVELYCLRATDDTSADGEAQWWIDGTAKDHFTEKDNFDNNAAWASVRFGAVVGLDMGTSGTLYLDELYGNETGDVIGA
jgi:hypothetical protein